MKKKKLKNLSLNWKFISNLRTTSTIVGGFRTESCEPEGICCPTHDVNCNNPLDDGNCGGGTTTESNEE